MRPASEATSETGAAAHTAGYRGWLWPLALVLALLSTDMLVRGWVADPGEQWAWRTLAYLACGVVLGWRVRALRLRRRRHASARAAEPEAGSVPVAAAAPADAPDGPADLLPALQVSGLAGWTYDPAADTWCWLAGQAVPPVLAAPARQSLEQVFADVHPDDLGAVQVALRHSLQHQQPLRVEFRRCGQHSPWRWVRACAAPAVDGQGRLQRLVGTLQDIDVERQAAEPKLAEASWHQRLLDAARDAVLVVDLDGCVLHGNGALAQLLGHADARPLLQRKVWQLGLLPAAERVLEALRAPGVDHQRTELSVVRRDGALLRLEVDASLGELGGRSVWFAVCRDITQRKRIELALRESEARFRATFDNSAVGMAENLVSGEWLSVNPRLCQITGYSRDALMALPPLMLTHPDDRERSQAQVQRLLRREVASCTVEKRYLRADGSITWVARTTSLVRSSEGRAEYFVSIVEDISERLQAQQAVHASEQHHQAVIDALSEGLLVFDRDGQVLRANPAARALLAIEGTALTPTMADWGLCHADGQPVLPDALPLQATLRSRQPVRAVVMALPRGAGTAWLQLNCEPMGDADSLAPGGAVVSLTDISERKHFEAELARHRLSLESQVTQRTLALQAAMQARAESERFLRSVADNLPDKIAYWDDQRVCRFANKAYREWFGHGGAPVLGMHREAMGDHLGRDDGDAGFRRALAGQAQHLQHPMVHPDGQRVQYAWIHLVPDWQHDRVAGVLELLSDVSAIKQAELRLRGMNDQLVQARDRAEQANRAKSLFLANVSHEIRTPMNAIIGLAHLMRRDLADPTVRGRLDRVTEAAHHLLDVINHVLDLSKIESGQLGLEHTEFTLSEVLARSVALVSERAEEKGLAISVTGTDALPARLVGDPTRVSQALLNLLGNAVKFTDQGSITLRCDHEASTGDAQVLRFSVHDTGPGVPAEQLTRLFQTFEQGDPSTTRRFGGTGLGLAITRRLAQLMGGDAGASSQVGQGSCFWFTARFNAPPPSADPGLTVRAPGQDGGSERRLREQHAQARVLLAEDNPVNQEVALALLHAAGLEVDCAVDGVEAAELARDNAYHAILMDMQMPRLDGLAATRQIRALPQHAQTPIIAMTANAFGDDRQACLDVGMDDHLAKPVDPERLYTRLLHWLAVRSAAPAPTAVPAATGNPAPMAHGLRPDASTGGSFDGIPGLAMTRALLYLPGRDAVFARVLRQFVDNYRHGLPELAAAVAERHWAVARRQLHSLRGACGAIGAADLLALAEALEQDLAHRPDGCATPQAVARAGQLQAMLRSLVQTVSARLQSQAVCTPAAQAAAENAGQPAQR
jgi:two-component system, sensor histidine kinase and response regulator